MDKFSWQISSLSKKSNARTGYITTPNGVIKTPAFIFCATKGALKSISTFQAKEAGSQIVLSNTYHLMLQPGSKLISEHGGLHKFMKWDGPLLTDSGGFQIFSLGHGSVAEEIKGNKNYSKKKKSLLKIHEEGALFKSYIDGSNYLLTPEKSIEVQRELGADIILVFDECTPFNVDKTYTANSMNRSHRWSKRSLNSFHNNKLFLSSFGSSGKQQIYGIIQGGIYDDLREESIEFNLKKVDVFGIAIGGSLGSTKEEMYNIVEFVGNKLDVHHPVHLLGIGDPKDIWQLVKSGIDTFDCVSPTRLARHGSALIKSIEGKINITNSRYAKNNNPIDINCNCQTCSNYSLSYINHLFKTNELIGLNLLTVHNIFFMNNLMQVIRKAIESDELDEAEKNWYL